MPEQAGQQSRIFKFADVEVHEREFQLVKAGEVLPVEPKAFRVLLFLLRNPQKVVRKEELLDAVWGDTAVSENSLARSIALLRRLLGDDAHEQRFIATVATVGYRFIAPVEALDNGRAPLESAGTLKELDEQEANDSPSEPTPVSVAVQPVTSTAGRTKNNSQIDGTADKLRRWLLTGAAVVIVCAVAAGWYLRRPLPPPRITEYEQITHDGHLKDLVGTDGSRLYFNQVVPQSIAQVATSGGEVVPMPLRLPSPWLQDVSPDGSALLVQSGDDLSLWSVGIPGTSLRRLTDAWSSSAAWSPDGKSVAYSTKEGNISLVRSDGTDARKLTSEVTWAHDLSWSPDGQVIRYTIDHSIWEISANGSNRHRVLPEGGASAWQCCGHWTLDGHFFLFLLGDKRLNRAPVLPGAQIWALDERRGLFRRPPAQPVQLTSGPIHWARAIPSKDGKKIFARGVTARGELARFDSQGNQFRPFLAGISAEYLSFTKDGKAVVYVSFPEGILWRANLDGSGLMQLTNPPMYPKNPRWSPDGTQILFYDASVSLSLDVSYVVSAEGGKARLLLPEDSGPQTDPNWSPDGHRIVFTTCDCDGHSEDAKSDIRILDLDSHRVTILPGSEGMYSPRWSPDGRSIVGLTIASHNLKIFEIETQRWSMLLKGDWGWPAWSQDSRYIYFVSVHDDPGVFRIRATGGDPERVVDLKGFHSTGWYSSWLGLDPTDAPLVLRDAGTDDIYALTLEVK